MYYFGLFTDRLIYETGDGPIKIITSTLPQIHKIKRGMGMAITSLDGQENELSIGLAYLFKNNNTETLVRI